MFPYILRLLFMNQGAGPYLLWERSPFRPITDEELEEIMAYEG